MRKGKVKEIKGNTTDGKQVVVAVVTPLEDSSVEVEAVLPWYLRGKSGNDIGAGDEVVYESFVDGTAYIVGRADGTWGEVLYGRIKLGDDSGTKPLAIAINVFDALYDIQQAFLTHTHSVPGVTLGEEAATSVVTTTTLWPEGVPEVKTSKITGV